MEKVVNGVIYESKPSSGSCEECAGHNGGDYGDLCDSLVETNCYWKYNFTFKGIKTTTEGVKYDSDKTQYSLVPPYALEAVAKNLTSGLKKYPHRNNWQLVDNAEERYLDAMLRHIEEHRKGNIYDTDNSDPTTTHLSAVAVNSMFLLELMLNPTLEKTNEHTN
jgi:Domain of unknown function (DUF5664)